jgi:hypothetical protein
MQNTELTPIHLQIACHMLANTGNSKNKWYTDSSPVQDSTKRIKFWPSTPLLIKLSFVLNYPPSKQWNFGRYVLKPSSSIILISHIFYSWHKRLIGISNGTSFWHSIRPRPLISSFTFNSTFSLISFNSFNKTNPGQVIYLFTSIPNTSNPPPLYLLPPLCSIYQVTH